MLNGLEYTTNSYPYSREVRGLPLPQDLGTLKMDIFSQNNVFFLPHSDKSPVNESKSVAMAELHQRLLGPPVEGDHLLVSA